MQIPARYLDKLTGLKCHINVRRSPWAIPLEPNKLSSEDVRLLYDRQGPALVGYACSIVTDAAIAEDVVHQVFVKLLQGETSVHDVSTAYMYRAVRNGEMNARRNGYLDAPLE